MKWKYKTKKQFHSTAKQQLCVVNVLRVKSKSNQEKIQGHIIQTHSS